MPLFAIGTNMHSHPSHFSHHPGQPCSIILPPPLPGLIMNSTTTASAQAFSQLLLPSSHAPLLVQASGTPLDDSVQADLLWHYFVCFVLPFPSSMPWRQLNILCILPCPLNVFEGSKRRGDALKKKEERQGKTSKIKQVESYLTTRKQYTKQQKGTHIDIHNNGDESHMYRVERKKVKGFIHMKF